MKTEKRTLNVKKVTTKDLIDAWGPDTLIPPGWYRIMYIQCNAKGEVRWDIASVYHPNELVERGNYKVF